MKENETQAKGLSKYAAKQQRLATDPTFGTTYIFDQISEAVKAKTEKRLAEEAEKAAEERQVRLDKIVKMEIEVRTIERHIANSRAQIVKLQAAIARQRELLTGEE